MCFNKVKSIFFCLEGNFILASEKLLSNNIWHDNLEVGVNSGAPSKISSSFSDGKGSLLYNSFSNITWQVEQAQPPSHAPIKLILCFLHASNNLSPFFPSTLIFLSLSKT